MRNLLLSLLLCAVTPAVAQIYVLKDHRDSTVINPVYQNLPELCDSIYSKFKLEDVSVIALFVPTDSFLWSMFDTSEIKYSAFDIALQQKRIQGNLEKEYQKILRKTAQKKIKLSSYELYHKEYTYGKNDKGNDFCYVKIKCRKRKKELSISFLALNLMDTWFLVDELSASW